MYCPKCGSLYHDTPLSCPACHAPLFPTQASSLELERWYCVYAKEHWRRFAKSPLFLIILILHTLSVLSSVLVAFTYSFATFIALLLINSIPILIISALWSIYENASSPNSISTKGIDKLQAIFDGMRGLIIVLTAIASFFSWLVITQNFTDAASIWTLVLMVICTVGICFLINYVCKYIMNLCEKIKKALAGDAPEMPKILFWPIPLLLLSLVQIIGFVYVSLPLVASFSIILAILVIVILIPVTCSPLQYCILIYMLHNNMRQLQSVYAQYRKRLYALQNSLQEETTSQPFNSQRGPVWKAGKGDHE